MKGENRKAEIKSLKYKVKSGNNSLKAENPLCILRGSLCPLCYINFGARRTQRKQEGHKGNLSTIIEL